MQPRSPICALPAVRWIGDYRPNYKLSPALSQQIASSGQQTGERDVSMSLPLSGESLSELQNAVSTQGGNDCSKRPTARWDHLCVPRFLRRGLHNWYKCPAVNWIEPYQTMELFNAQGRKVMNAEYVWQDFGYYGQGQIIAISDSGLSVQGSLSPDFAGRLVKAFAPSEMKSSSPTCRAKTTFTDLNGHGTHVAGSVLGNGAQSGSNAANHQYTASHAGTAPEAQLVFMALNTDGSGRHSMY